MDGGVANNTPISHAVELGAREIYVLPTGHSCALEQPPASALGMALHALTLLTQSRLIADVEPPRSREARRAATAVPAWDPADRLRPRRGADRALTATTLERSSTGWYGAPDDPDTDAPTAARRKKRAAGVT